MSAFESRALMQAMVYGVPYLLAQPARCACCDLPHYSCGTAKMLELRAEDPEFAAFVEAPEGARL